MQKNVGEQEKAIRMLTGAVLLAASILPRRWLLPAGVVLLWTANTRYCPVNEAIGRDTSEGAEDSMMMSGEAQASRSGQSQNAGSQPATRADQRALENAAL